MLGEMIQEMNTFAMECTKVGWVCHRSITLHLIIGDVGEFNAALQTKYNSNFGLSKRIDLKKNTF
jgi:hypothetical protein